MRESYELVPGLALVKSEVVTFPEFITFQFRREANIEKVEILSWMSDYFPDGRIQVIYTDPGHCNDIRPRVHDKEFYDHATRVASDLQKFRKDDFMGFIMKCWLEKGAK